MRVVSIRSPPSQCLLATVLTSLTEQTYTQKEEATHATGVLRLTSGTLAWMGDL